MRRLRYLIAILLFVAALQAAGEEYVIEKVFVGATRHYRVEGHVGSKFEWMINNVVIVNPIVKKIITTDSVTGKSIEISELEIQWDEAGVFHLAVKQFSMASMFKCDVLEQGIVEVTDPPVIILPPIAVNDTFNLWCNLFKDGNVILNDTVNVRYSPYTIPIVRTEHGELKLFKDGTFEYRSDPLFSGVDQFTYALLDQNKFPNILGLVVLNIIADKDRDHVEDPPYDDPQRLNVTKKWDPDADGDGILNTLDGFYDFDKDGWPNYLDIDSDGDGIVDNIEAQGTGDYRAPVNFDANTNGINDAYEGLQSGYEINPVDTDGDGKFDFLDLDSDNDHVLDRIEGNDIDSNGQPNFTAKGEDSDGDGLDDGYDTYFIECDAMDNIIRSSSRMQHSDTDDIPDWRDDNDDGDQYLTWLEDLDGDGDYSDDDFDYDGIPEYLDYGRECELLIPEAFSPNKDGVYDEDGVHDFFQIYCINHFPNAKIYIFDQFGNKLYEKANYGNLEKWGTFENAWWNGKPDRGRGKGELLPPGTYYYVLDLGNGEVKKSFVFISY